MDGWNYPRCPRLSSEHAKDVGQQFDAGIAKLKYLYTICYFVPRWKECRETTGPFRLLIRNDVED